jgi:hypothetical protein
VILDAVDAKAALDVAQEPALDAVLVRRAARPALFLDAAAARRAVEVGEALGAVPFLSTAHLPVFAIEAVLTRNARDALSILASRERSAVVRAQALDALIRRRITNPARTVIVRRATRDFTLDVPARRQNEPDGEEESTPSHHHAKSLQVQAPGRQPSAGH